VKLMLAAFGGLCAGQAVVWYASQFYALFFLEKMLKVDGALANTLVAVALALATPFFVVFGWLSDKIGRRPVILGGCVLAALTYFPIFHGLTSAANPDLAAATARAPVVVVADPATCHFQFDPVGKQAFTSGCDIAKAALANAGVSYVNRAAAPGAAAAIQIGGETLPSLEGASLTKPALKTAKEGWTKGLAARLKTAGYPLKADPAKVNRPAVVALLWLLVIYATMAYGPIAAALVEMFPARIRYTSMSMPYHLGAGWLGGFLPTTAFAMVAATGDIYYGLWYPVVAAALSTVVGIVFLREMNGAPIDA
jgi:MFS family permease